MTYCSKFSYTTTDIIQKHRGLEIQYINMNNKKFVYDKNRRRTKDELKHKAKELGGSDSFQLFIHSQSFTPFHEWFRTELDDISNVQNMRMDRDSRHPSRKPKIYTNLKEFVANDDRITKEAIDALFSGDAVKSHQNTPCEETRKKMERTFTLLR